jgi:hypothetical protein
MNTPYRLVSAAITVALAAIISNCAPALASPRTASVLYVADNVHNAVYLFNAQNLNAPLLGSITSGVAQPSSIALDKKGNLYVANAAAQNVAVYKHGATSPSRIIAMASLGIPAALAVGSDDTLVVGYDGVSGRDSGLAIFDKGSSQATRSIALRPENNTDVSVGAVAIEAGSMYVSVTRSPNGPSQLLEFAPGSSKGVDTGIAPGTGEAFDGLGNFYVDSGVSVSVYSPGQTQARYVIPNLINAGQIVTAPNGTLFVPDGQDRICSQFTEPGYVAEYAPGSQNPSAYLSSSYLQNPVSLALLLSK